MTITRIGTNQKYAAGWDVAFSGKPNSDKRGGPSGAKSTQKKAAPSKKAAPKKTKKGKK